MAAAKSSSTSPSATPPRKGNADGGGSSAVGSPFTTSSSHEEEKKWVGAAAFLRWEKWKWGHSNPCSLPCCSASKPSVIEPGGSGKGTDGAAGVSAGSARSSLLHPPCLASSLSWPWAEQNSSRVTGKHSTLIRQLIAARLLVAQRCKEVEGGRRCGVYGKEDPIQGAQETHRQTDRQI